MASSLEPMMDDKKFHGFFKGFLFLLIGVALAIGACMSAIHTDSFLRTSLVAQGRVVALNAGKHHPEIAFTTQDGRDISYPQGGFVSMDIGEQVQIRYLPENPRSSASVDRFFPIWQGTIAAGFFGLLACAASFSCFLSTGMIFKRR